ncbi:hypothetical protein [Geobacter sp. DSM 9736]|uniref:hypothetical protein n=1 Tax=Geobacter sp. DSM 9736 TaxID=1277350 RepID=UPI000B50E075|nr:hypothetical protein [Geobacter sp. DSM 9736]SNB45701.1 hypothetical protein SAMN06269301_1129 [Geobacter sp. DSM 9736]
MEDKQGFVLKVVFLMLIASILSAFIVKELPGRYQISGPFVIDTTTGIIKRLTPLNQYPITFDKLP